MNNLTKSITIHSAYGVEVEYENGTVCRVDVNQPLYNYTEKTISVHVAIQDIENKEAKLLLHSLDKLITNILDDENDFFYQMNNDLCDILGTSDCEYFVKSLIKGDYYAIDVTKAKDAFNYLLEKGYNVFGLSSEFVKDKSEIKERGVKIIDKSKNFEKDLDKYENQFSTNECDCIGKENFAYERTVANGEVWHCKEHNVEIMTDEEPKEDNY